MAKAKDTKAGARSIGLATEHRLPEAFKARTDADAGTVEIRRPTGRPLEVAINSFASVANVLAVFSPDGEPSLKPEHTIRIVDDFAGKEVTITANTFVDVAAAFQVFLVEKGRYLPSAAPAEASRETEKAVETQPTHDTEPASDEKEPPAIAQEEAGEAEKAPVTASDKTAETSGPKKTGSGAPKSGKKAAPAAGKKSTASSAKEVKASPGGKKAAGAAGGKASVPDWAKDLPVEHVDPTSAFRLEARSLALTKERGKLVEGVADASSQFTAFGYEVLQGDKPGGKHVGWLIVEDPKSWVVTGFGDIPPSKHANLAAASIRIRVTNLPQVV